MVTSHTCFDVCQSCTTRIGMQDCIHNAKSEGEKTSRTMIGGRSHHGSRKSCPARLKRYEMSDQPLHVPRVRRTHSKKKLPYKITLLVLEPARPFSSILKLWMPAFEIYGIAITDRKSLKSWIPVEFVPNVYWHRLATIPVWRALFPKPRTR